MKFIAIVEEKKNIMAIASRLRRLGCTSVKVMRITGIITGDSGTKSLNDIAIQGLRSVEEDRTKRL